MFKKYRAYEFWPKNTILIYEPNDSLVRFIRNSSWDTCLIEFLEHGTIASVFCWNLTKATPKDIIRIKNGKQ